MRRLDQGIALDDLCSLINGRLVQGRADTLVFRLAPLESAQAGDLSFLSTPAYREQAARSLAAAVITSPALADAVPPGCGLIEVSDPYRAYGVVARHLASLLSPPRQAGRHPSAVVAADARIDPSVRIDAQCVIESGVSIGAGAVIGAGCVIGPGAQVGAGTVLHPRVTIEADCELGSDCIVHSGTVIGSDGFGFARGAAGWEKIPQLGRVVIGHGVEIGSNCSIDRGALADTTIGDGCKLDNLIQVAHNVQIGDHTAIAGCVGIAGSARIGRRCMIGGSAGILGHLEICDDVTVSAMSLVTRSITEPGFYSGIFPIMDNADWERAAVLLRKLPDLRARLRRLEARLKEDR